MAIYESTGNGSAGATVTASSLAFSGSPSGTVAVTTGMVYDASGGFHATTTGQAVNVPVATTDLLIRFYVNFSVVPSGTDFFIGGSYYTGTTYGARVLINSASNLRHHAVGSGSAVTPGVPNAAVGTDPGADYPSAVRTRIEHYQKASTDGVNGQIRTAWYLGESTTPVWDSGLVTAANTAGNALNTAGSTGNIATARFVVGSNLVMDHLGIKTGSDAVWGAWVAEGPPIIAVTESDDWYSADYRASTSAGTLSFGIAHTSGPNHLTDVKEPVEGWFFIPKDATGSSTYTVTATASPSGLTTDDIVSVPAASAGTGGMDYLYCDGVSYS